MTISLRVQQQLMESALSSSSSSNCSSSSVFAAGDRHQQPQRRLDTQQHQVVVAAVGTLSNQRPSIASFSSSSVSACLTTTKPSKRQTNATGSTSPLAYKVWTHEEHSRFLEALTLFPSGPWKKIAQHIGTRTPRQAMTHAQKFRQKLTKASTSAPVQTPTTNTNSNNAKANAATGSATTKRRPRRRNSMPGKHLCSSPIACKNWRASNELFLPKGIEFATSPIATKRAHHNFIETNCRTSSPIAVKRGSQSFVETNCRNGSPVAAKRGSQSFVETNCRLAKKPQEAVLFATEIDLDLIDASFRKHRTTAVGVGSPSTSSECSATSSLGESYGEHHESEEQDVDMDAITDVLDNIATIHAADELLNLEMPSCGASETNDAARSSWQQASSLTPSTSRPSIAPPSSPQHLNLSMDELLLVSSLTSDHDQEMTDQTGLVVQY